MAIALRSNREAALRFKTKLKTWTGLSSQSPPSCSTLRSELCPTSHQCSRQMCSTSTEVRPSWANHRESVRTLTRTTSCLIKTCTWLKVISSRSSHSTLKIGTSASRQPSTATNKLRKARAKQVIRTPNSTCYRRGFRKGRFRGSEDDRKLCVTQIKQPLQMRLLPIT